MGLGLGLGLGARHAIVGEGVHEGAGGGHARGLAGEAARRVERDQVDVCAALEGG